MHVFGECPIVHNDEYPYKGVVQENSTIDHDEEKISMT
jgi:hypothetical protein